MVRAACSDLCRASRDARDEISLLFWIFIVEKLERKGFSVSEKSQSPFAAKGKASLYSLGPFFTMVGEDHVASSLSVSRGKLGNGVGLRFPRK